MTRSFDFSIGEFYHLYNRGVDKRIIFLDDEDYRRFVKLLFICNSNKRFNYYDVFNENTSENFNNIERGLQLVSIGAWCLMPNHFHLLVKENLEVKPPEQKNSGISLFMQKLLTAYSMYFNRKYKRRGSLFEGTFNARHADRDEYLKYLYAYIHLNPIGIIDKGWKNKKIHNYDIAKKHLENYKYSSYLDYIGEKRSEYVILDSVDFPEYFKDVTDFKQLIEEWMNFSDIKSGG